MPDDQPEPDEDMLRRLGPYFRSVSYFGSPSYFDQPDSEPAADADAPRQDTAPSAPIKSSHE